jgi:hypothetical protein
MQQNHHIPQEPACRFDATGAVQRPGQNTFGAGKVRWKDNNAVKEA